MTDKAALVEQLMMLPRETRQVEFKAASGLYSHEKALEYCAALANGGWWSSDPRRDRQAPTCRLRDPGIPQHPRC